MFGTPRLRRSAPPTLPLPAERRLRVSPRRCRRPCPGTCRRWRPLHPLRRRIPRPSRRRLKRRLRWRRLRLHLRNRALNRAYGMTSQAIRCLQPFPTEPVVPVAPRRKCRVGARFGTILPEIRSQCRLPLPRHRKRLPRHTVTPPARRLEHMRAEEAVSTQPRNILSAPPLNRRR